MDDKRSIIVRSYIDVGHNIAVSNPKKWFTLSIDFRDGKYRYNLSRIIYEFDVILPGANNHYEENFSSWLKYSSNPNTKKREKINAQLEDYASNVNAEFQRVIKSLKDSMSDNPNDDW